MEKTDLDLLKMTLHSLRENSEIMQTKTDSLAEMAGTVGLLISWEKMNIMKT